MERNTWFFRLFFVTISCLSAIAYELSYSNSSLFWSILQGSFTGVATSGLLMLLETFLQKCSLRSLSTAIVGLFIGTLMALVLTLSLKLLFVTLSPQMELSSTLLLFTFLSCIYLGIMLTASSSESWWLSIPFVRLAPASGSQKKEILVDISALEDSRLIELARCGLLDHQLVLPTFIVKDIHKAMESPDETSRVRARKCYEHLKRLENIETLGLQIKEFHFNDSEEMGSKLARAAKLLQAYILTAQDQSLLRSEDDDAIVISLETIATALKPGAQRGEVLQIKIQRLGKEPKQGVGYLEDGTMVVVNGGGEFLGQQIRTQVLSQKYSSSGKIVFCNAINQDEKALPRTHIPEGSTYVAVG